MFYLSVDEDTGAACRFSSSAERQYLPGAAGEKAETSANRKQPVSVIG